jgi:ribonuclease-3
MGLPRFLRKNSSSKQDPLFQLVKNIIAFSPVDLSLYKCVFTHTSMEKTDEDGQKINYERLEFLGDAVLNTIVAAHLFKSLPRNNEGSLTLMRSKIVRRDFLNMVGEQLGLIDHLSSNVPTKNYSQHVHGNLFEALVGAVYIDLGFERCSSFVFDKMIYPFVNLEKLEYMVLSYKSLLVDWFQKKRIKYAFDVELDDGAEQTNYYKATLLIDGKATAKARAKNKKRAMEKVAKRAYFKFQNNIKSIHDKH